MKTLKLIGLYLECAWLAVYTTFDHLRSPLWVVCANCEKALGGNPQSKSISHGMCTGCYFKTVRPLLLVTLAVLSLGLSACEKKSRMTAAVDEEAYCREHPTECVMRAQEVEVRP